MTSVTEPTYGVAPSTPSGTYFVEPIPFFWKYRSLEFPEVMTPRDPMPRYCLYLLPLTMIVLPGASSVPANMLPIITDEAPATIALATSPLYLTPPSAMTGTPAGSATSHTFAMAVTCGTPTPATIRVVQIEPGPMPTLI